MRMGEDASLLELHPIIQIAFGLFGAIVLPVLFLSFIGYYIQSFSDSFGLSFSTPGFLEPLSARLPLVCGTFVIWFVALQVVTYLSRHKAELYCLCDACGHRWTPP